MFKPKGKKRGFPNSSCAIIGCIPKINAKKNEEITTEIKPARNRLNFSPNLFKNLKVKYADPPPNIPTAKAFIGSVVIPPSPKNTACIKKTIEITKNPVIYPKTTDKRPIPRGWAVTPPGRGIIIRVRMKEKADKRAINGIVSSFNSLFNFLMLYNQRPEVTMYAGI